ncbi:hypothetical protein DL768_001713 [Monosporascus sp. mg162]|nr:hypothetical protein DL768_001713 [Monosporascus sp. mg162]
MRLMVRHETATETDSSSDQASPVATPNTFPITSQDLPNQELSGGGGGSNQDAMRSLTEAGGDSTAQGETTRNLRVRSQQIPCWDAATDQDGIPGSLRNRDRWIFYEVARAAAAKPKQNPPLHRGLFEIGLPLK